MNIPVWSVRSVKPREDDTSRLTFASGEKRVYGARPLLKRAVYSQLNNPGFLMNVHVEGDAVVWSDEIDIVPGHLYECSGPVEGGL